METTGEKVPEPLAERRFSGEFVTRVPGDLHRLLAIEAAEAGISLNRLVSFKLAIPLLARSAVPRATPSRRKSPARP
jgi:predicted HicB family RNase H-like nuclease